MINTLKNENTGIQKTIKDEISEELNLSVAPACNMMCNFCSKVGDCLSNGNNPEYLTKTMTPRQAVNCAISNTKLNKSIKIIKLAGPGEPLCSRNTFEVLKRLNVELPNHVYSVSTNGLELERNVDELANLNVENIEVAVSAFSQNTMAKLYSRLMKDTKILVNSTGLGKVLLQSQIEGVRKSIRRGINVKINMVYFPEINKKDIYKIVEKFSDIGVKSFCIISGFPNGKFINTKIPSIRDLNDLKIQLLQLVPEVEIKKYFPFKQLRGDICEKL